MFGNYLKIAWRNIRNSKMYSLISISGLAVGIACCLLILLFVQNELNYDRFHEKAERIYRVTYGFQLGSQAREISVTPTIVGPMLKRDFPEVTEMVRVFEVNNFGPSIVSYGSKQFQESRFMFGDSTMFSIFSFPFVQGDPETAISRPGTIVLTESTARKIFGSENPLGKTLKVDNTRDFEITGVVADLPSNSHLQFDYMASFSTLRQSQREIWGSANYFTYVLTNSPGNPAALNKKIAERITEYTKEMSSGNPVPIVKLQPLSDVYLHSKHLDGGARAKGDIGYVYGFSVLALLILVVACINYMNLATARSSRRAKEVGMRKVLGAQRNTLISQFFGESIIITGISMLLALILVQLFLPAFNLFIGKTLSFNFINNPEVLVLVLIVGFLVSIVAGSYPALFLSRFQPAAVLKGEVKRSGGAVLFRKALVVFQFGVSVFLIVGSLVVDSQLSYLQNKKLGLAKEQMVIVPIGDRETIGNLSAIKNELMRDAGVLGVTASSSIPGKVMGGYSVAAEGLPEGENPPTTGWIVDKDFPSVLDLELIAGNTFQETFIPEKGYDYVINESLARRIGWQPEEAVGKWLNVLGNRMGRVIGVARDFHFRSLHNEIGPLALFISPRNFEYLMVKIAPENIVATMGHIDRVWAKLVPYRPFEYTFLDQEYEGLYRAEVRSGQLLTVFTLLAILIACLGLFGLAAFTAEQRTREIGIRKVLGASVGSIILMLSKDFGRLIVLAIVLASPLAYWIMNNWLQNFAYRIDVSWLTLIVAGIAALIIAIGTITYQAVKAALTNPIKALKYE